MKKQSYPIQLRLLSWVPSILSLIIVLAVAIPLFWFVLPTGILVCRVDGDSMDITLHDGQLMYQAGRDFSRGDIVICNSKEEDGTEKVLIKRIVGMPGETLRIDANGVYINEEKLNEDYLTDDAVAGTYRENKVNSITLGADDYFLLGDNRRISYDSRYFGSVPLKDMLFVVSDAPSQPFYLAAVLILALIVLLCMAELQLDALLLRLFCKRFPALDQMVQQEKEKEKEKEKAKGQKKEKE